MSIYEASITNPKKQLEFYKQLSEQLQQENKELKEQLNNPLKGIFAQVNDNELLICNAMNYKDAQDYKQALLDIKEYIEENITLYDEWDKCYYWFLPEEYKELLSKLNKALGSDK